MTKGSHSNRSRKSLAPLVLAPALLALSGCQPPLIDITVEKVGDDHVVTLSQDVGLIFSDIEVPCVDRVQLISGDNYREPVWHITAQPTGTDECRRLEQFTVGEIPEGYEQAVALPTGTKGTFSLLVEDAGMNEVDITID